MTGTERKRRWRLANSQRSRAAERKRAWLRRQHGRLVIGPLRPERFFYASGISYQQYEADPYPSMDPDEQPERDAWYARVSAGHGRKESRFRQDQKRRQERIAFYWAQNAAINKELGLPADASLKD